MVLTISDVRKNFAAVVDAVIDDAEECVIPRGGGKAVVIVSFDEWQDYDGWLQRDPKMARRISELIIDVQRDPRGTGLGKPTHEQHPRATRKSDRLPAQALRRT
jgi:antitoxin YefM